MELADETLCIRFAEEPEGSTGVLKAVKSIVGCWSSCAKGLPAAAQEWDVSQLLIEGQPVQRDTVMAWLNSVYYTTYRQPFEQPEQKPAGRMTGLAKLLGFAGAVGSSRGLLLAIDFHINISAGTLIAEARLGEQDLQLAAGKCYFFRDSGMNLFCIAPGNPASHKVATASSEEDKKRFRLQLVQQIEPLLYLALTLQLPKLQQVVSTCISCNACWGGSLLYKGMEDIVPACVLSAGTAAGCLVVCDAFVACSSTELCAFASTTGVRHLLKPLNTTPEQQQPIEFKALAMHDFLCYRKGEVLTARPIRQVSHDPAAGGRLHPNPSCSEPCPGATAAVRPLGGT